LKKGLLLEQFVNWGSEDRDILRFVQRYGPLLHSPFKSGGFAFNLQLWETWQKMWRDRWRELTAGPGEFEFRSSLNGTLMFVAGRFELRVNDLDTFMMLEAAASDRTRFRICANPDCLTPYFFARHRRNRYCTEPCVDWSQKEAKKKWWKDNGQEWRKSRDAKSP